MATLTQKAQHPNMDKAWDETIVPALRKRLESESRILSKRLSAQSIPSADEKSASTSVPTSRRQMSAGVNSIKGSKQAESSRPSAIPRPSLSNDAISVLNGVRKARSPTPTNIPGPSKIPPVKRARTHSTPYPFDRESVTSGSSSPTNAPPIQQSQSQQPRPSGLPTPASSRSASPMVYPPSRIPMAARGRSASKGMSGATTSRSATVLSGKYVEPQSSGVGRERQLGQSKSTTQLPPSPQTSPDLWPVAEDHSDKQKTKRDPEGNKEVKIRDEEPPFPLVQSRTPSLSDDPSHSTSVQASTVETEASRPEEFEHWYRGEGRTGGGRNGGKGEIMIGTSVGMTAKEMLEIAVVGHRVGSPVTRKEWMTWNEAETDNIDMTGWPEDRVLDEHPLTDLDMDSGMDSDVGRIREILRRRKAGQEYSESERTAQPERIPSHSTPPEDTTMSDFPTAEDGPPSPPPLPSPSPPPAPSAPVMVSSSSLKVPGTAPTGPISSSSQARPRTQSKPPQSRSRSRSTKGPTRQPTSSSTTDSTPLVDAVPSMPDSEPLLVTRDGSTGTRKNWDEIVLPTVARKMFPESTAVLPMAYLGVDTKGKKKYQEEERAVEPAPGTFGYDASKARIKVSKVGQPFEMSEFGQRRDELERRERERAESDAPFSSYLPSPSMLSLATHPDNDNRPIHPAEPLGPSHRQSLKELRKNRPVVMVTSPSLIGDRPQVKVVVEEEAGCCRCVIM